MSSITNSPGGSDLTSQQKTRPLPGSNKSPCQCESTEGDRVTGIPDNVLRPVRKEISVADCTPDFVDRNKGYNVVKPA